jgi:hypothetical protein
MPISRAMMRRQLRSKGGIMQLADRDEYFLGGIVKSVKKAVSGAVDTVTDFAKSDIGKMALLAAGGYYAGGGSLFGLQRAGMSGFSLGNLPGASLFSKAPGVTNIVDEVALTGGKGISQALKTGAKILTGSALITSLFGSPQAAQEMYQRNPGVVKNYIAQYYKNINPDATDEEIETFASSQLGEYAAKQDLANGGRVGFEEGGTFLTMEEAAKRNPTLFMDTTTYNPIPEDADRQAAAEIARTMMAVRSLPREDGEIEDTETMSTKDFMINEYFKPKRKELMENFGLSLEEANNLIKEAVAQIRDKKADGGMPTGIMRLNQAGVKERDYREDGGFVPVGIKEKADDVPAMLSKNEFVFTADAVRGAGNGDVEKGAQRMYKIMKTLENGGTV